MSDRLTDADSLGVRPSFGSRVAGVEGMRALAALSIVVYHVWYLSPSGERELGPLSLVLPDFAFGVTLFFALSGFLLYRPFVASVLRERPLPSVRGYFWNRGLRILPAYWVILLLAALVFQSVLVRDESGLRNGSGFDAGLLLRSALLVQEYAPSQLGVGICPAWSLAVEAVFYLVLPLLALAAWRLARRARSRVGRRRAALAPAAALLIFGLLGKLTAALLVPPVYAYAGWRPDWHSVIELSFWCQADLFAFGMALAVLRIDHEDGLLRLPRGWRPALAAAALAGYLGVAVRTGKDEQLGYSSTNTVMALVCALLLALVVLAPSRDSRPPLLIRILETRLLVAAGLISYSIFLWHEPLIRFLQQHELTFGGPAGFFANIAVTLVVVGGLSTLTYRLVEAPALRLKARTRAPAARPPEIPPAESAPALETVTSAV